jgi:hypothetical protein
MLRVLAYAAMTVVLESRRKIGTRAKHIER